MSRDDDPTEFAKKFSNWHSMSERQRGFALALMKVEIRSLQKALIRTFEMWCKKHPNGDGEK